MNGKVVSLNGEAVTGQPVPETIELLEQVLEKARSGEIRSVAVVGVKPNYHVFSCWHSEGQYYTLIGGLSWLSHRMNSGDS